MSFLIIVAKVLVTLFLGAFFIAGVFKANPRMHDPEKDSMAEYVAGFLICLFSLSGLYYFWGN